MRHIIIASHYGLAAGLGDTLKAIIGPGHDIRVVCAFTDETPLEEKLASAFEGIAEDDETLVLTDILQGSVNQLVACSAPRGAFIVTGVNLPVALELSRHAGPRTPEGGRQGVTQAKEQLVYLGDLTPDVDEEDE